MMVMIRMSGYATDDWDESLKGRMIMMKTLRFQDE